MWATSDGSCLAPIPSADRKAGSPDSVLMPAPVSTTHGRRRSSSSTSLAMLMQQRYASPQVGKTPGIGSRLVDGYSFSTPVRVRFADTDAQGIAHNASYLVWFEI